MSHLHLPDGLLPPGLWIAGLVVTLALLGLFARRGDAGSQAVAYRGALGALMLVAMAVPLGPFEYHLTLAGPVGILVGAAGGLQVAFVVSAILALIGHGGITVIGLNALLLGAGAATARVACRALIGRLRPELAVALGTACGQAVAGALWLAVVAVALGTRPAGDAPRPGMAMFSGVAVPLWGIGIAVEAVVAYGIARFLVRVRPDLLPAPGGDAARSAARRR